MKDYTSDNPVFSDKIPILETTDTNHADNVNVTTKQLLQNTLSNRRLINESMGDTGEYSEDVEYHTGDYCMREKVLYRCLEDTTEEWKPECWQKTTAIGEVINLQNSLNALLKMFGTDEEGNMRQLGEAAFAGISHNFATVEKNFVAGADLLKTLKDQVDEQNSASEANMKAEAHQSKISFSDAFVGDSAEYPIADLDYLANNINNFNSGIHNITNSDSIGSAIFLGKLSVHTYYVGIVIPRDISMFPLIFAYTSGTYSLIQFKWCTTIVPDIEE